MFWPSLSPHQACQPRKIRRRKKPIDYIYMMDQSIQTMYQTQMSEIQEQIYIPIEWTGWFGGTNIEVREIGWCQCGFEYRLTLPTFAVKKRTNIPKMEKTWRDQTYKWVQTIQTKILFKSGRKVKRTRKTFNHCLFTDEGRTPLHKLSTRKLISPKSKIRR